MKTKSLAQVSSREFICKGIPSICNMKDPHFFPRGLDELDLFPLLRGGVKC